MDTTRDGAGKLVEHASRQSCCLQLDSGRSLDQIICDFSRPPTPFQSMVRGRRYYEDVRTILVYVRVLGRDTECSLQACQLSRSSVSTHFLSLRRDVALFDSTRAPDGF